MDKVGAANNGTLIGGVSQGARASRKWHQNVRNWLNSADLGVAASRPLSGDKQA